jgi:ornithine carbamoyltransferase
MTNAPASTATAKKPFHFLTGTEFSRADLESLIDLAAELKAERLTGGIRDTLWGKSIALIFDKPSFRTRLSFATAIHELSGHILESVESNRKGEPPEDLQRVLNGYAHGVMVRTFEQSRLVKMAEYASIPIINGLSDTHHPCQVLADLLAIRETFGGFKGVKISYVGDGNNMLHSLLLMFPFLGGEIHYSCPPGYEPDAIIVKEALRRAKEGGGKIREFSSPVESVKGVQAIYTDVWASMGFEKEQSVRERAFADYQVNRGLVAAAGADCRLMHCLPMERGKEISEEMAESPKAMFWLQAENRLHAQKALLVRMFDENAR